MDRLSSLTRWHKADQGSLPDEQLLNLTAVDGQWAEVASHDAQSEEPLSNMMASEGYMAKMKFKKRMALFPLSDLEGLVFLNCVCRSLFGEAILFRSPFKQ